MLPSVKWSSTQAVSILNAQFTSFSMGISSWIWCHSIPKLSFNILDKNKKSEPMTDWSKVRIILHWSNTEYLIQMHPLRSEGANCGSGCIFVLSLNSFFSLADLDRNNTAIAYSKSITPLLHHAYRTVNVSLGFSSSENFSLIFCCSFFLSFSSVSKICRQ